MSGQATGGFCVEGGSHVPKLIVSLKFTGMVNDAGSCGVTGGTCPATPPGGSIGVNDKVVSTVMKSSAGGRTTLLLWVKICVGPISPSPKRGTENGGVVVLILPVAGLFEMTSELW